jgi:hypothetical protein
LASNGLVFEAVTREYREPLGTAQRGGGFSAVSEAISTPRRAPYLGQYVDGTAWQAHVCNVTIDYAPD